MRECLRSLPLEADEVDIVGRRLEGMALRWDHLYDVTDDGVAWYQEGFRRGCCDATLRSRHNVFELRDDHADERVGIVGFSEADDGLTFTARMDWTPEGDRQLDLLRNHRRNGVSIRYGAVRDNPRHGPPFWRAEIMLRELSLTDRPQYADAKVLAIRSQPERRRYVTPPEVAALLDWPVPAI